MGSNSQQPRPHPHIKTQVQFRPEVIIKTEREREREPRENLTTNLKKREQMSRNSYIFFFFFLLLFFPISLVESSLCSSKGNFPLILSTHLLQHPFPCFHFNSLYIIILWVLVEILKVLFFSLIWVQIVSYSVFL